MLVQGKPAPDSPSTDCSPWRGQKEGSHQDLPFCSCAPSGSHHRQNAARGLCLGKVNGKNDGHANSQRACAFVHTSWLQWLKNSFNLTWINWDNHPCLDFNEIDLLG